MSCGIETITHVHQSKFIESKGKIPGIHLDVHQFALRCVPGGQLETAEIET